MALLPVFPFLYIPAGANRAFRSRLPRHTDLQRAFDVYLPEIADQDVGVVPVLAEVARRVDDHVDALSASSFAMYASAA